MPSHSSSACLDDSISDDEIFIPNFSIIRRDRNRHGGSIAIYVHDSSPFKVRSKNPSTELMLIDIKLKSKTMTCGVYYRPPSSDPSDITNLEASLEELPPSLYKSLLLLGDFNIDLISTTNPILEPIVDKLCLKQVVSSPTRTTPTSSTLIDHIYLSEGLVSSSCAILPPVADSDHSTISLCLSNPSPPTSPFRKARRLYQRADFETACSTLRCLSSHAFPANDINSLWFQWWDYFMTMSQTIPSTIIKRSQNLPFLT